MGCTTSCIAPSVAELNKSVKAGDERALLLQLAACPKLLSTPTSVLSSSALTPMHQACESKQVKVVQEILSFMACSSIEIVQEALLPYCRRAGQQLPASVNEGIRMAVDMTNAKGQTPLMYACFSGCPELVKLLLSKGADPWAGDRCGHRTALHYAAMGGSSDCIQALMKHIPARLVARQGVRYVDARSLCGLTPLHYCIYYGNMEALRELLHHCNPALNAATTSESYDVSVTCEASSCPLHFAGVTGNEEAAREVLLYYFQRLGSNQAIADPRTRMNAARQLPWEVALAHHPAQLSLASLLHPGQPLERVLGAASAHAGGPGGLGLGPPPLAAIAGAALRAKLLADLQAIQRQDQAEAEANVEEAGKAEELDVAAAAAVTAAPAAVLCDETVALMPPVVDPVSSGGGSCGPAATSGGSRDGRESKSRPGRCGGRRSAAVAPLPPACHAASSTALQGHVATASGSSVGRPVAACAAGVRGADGSGASASRGCLVAEREGVVAHAEAEVQRPGQQQQQQDGDRDGDDEEDEEEEGQQCEVCFAARVAVSPASCSHGLCGGCAEQLSRGVTRRPLHCPFCRRVVAGFVVFSPLKA